MQNKREDLYMCDDHVTTPSSKYNRYYSNQEDMDNSEMSVDLSDSNLPKARNLTSQLKTANELYSGMTTNFNIKLLSDDQNVDMENWWSQVSSQEMSQQLTRESSTATWGSQDSFSAKFRAPVKQSNTRKYRLMKGFDKEIISATEFLNKLNDTEKQQEDFSLLDDHEDEMTLEQHLEALSRKYTKQESTPQTQNSFSENLQMRIIPKTWFGKGMQVILQNKKTYYQKVKQGTTRISITFPAMVGHEDLLKYSNVFKLSKTKFMTCCEFFSKLNKDLWEKGLNLTIKVNDEPIFPAKTTLEYLSTLYQNSKAKIRSCQ